jgi:hypothetical protein
VRDDVKPTQILHPTRETVDVLGFVGGNPCLVAFWVHAFVANIVEDFCHEEVVKS